MIGLLSCAPAGWGKAANIVRAGRTDRKTMCDIAILLLRENFNSPSKPYHKESQAGIAPTCSFRAVDRACTRNPRRLKRHVKAHSVTLACRRKVVLL
jgi:hypothetical protein